MGNSEIISDTSKNTYKLPPNTNEFFKGKRICIRITEQVDKIVDGRPNFPFISYKRQKAEPSLTLHWQVSDRALFSRIVNICTKPITLVFFVRLKATEQFYFDLLEQQSIESSIPLRGISFYIKQRNLSSQSGANTNEN
jgi:hypothetical protein